MKKPANYSLLAAIWLWYGAAAGLMNLSKAFAFYGNFSIMLSNLILPLLVVAANGLLGFAIFRQNRGGLLIGAFVLKLVTVVLNYCLIIDGIMIRLNFVFLFKNNYGLSCLLVILCWVFLLLLAVRTVRDRDGKKNGMLLWILALACQILGLLFALSYTNGMLATGISVSSYLFSAAVGIMTTVFIGLGLTKPVVETDPQKAGEAEEKKTQNADVSAYRELLEAGVISQEEFDIWMAQNGIQE